MNNTGNEKEAVSKNRSIQDWYEHLVYDINDDAFNKCSDNMYTLRPDEIMQTFVETAENASICNVLLPLCIISSISYRVALNDYIIQRQNDPSFNNALMVIKPKWTHNGIWNFSALHLAGQCILETGFNFKSIKVYEYRAKIHANSIYSPNISMKRLSSKVQAIVVSKRARYTREEVYSNGIKILNHMSSLYYNSLDEKNNSNCNGNNNNVS